MGPRAAAVVYRRHPDFVSVAAKAQYDIVKTRPIVIEKGFDIPERADYRPYINTIVAHNWVLFCAPRDEVNNSWVQEFYANARYHRDFTTQVRGKAIDFSAAAINSFFGTTSEDQEEYPQALVETTNAQLAATICLNNEIIWKGQGERLFSSKCLNRQAKIWHLFESASIFPTLHISDFARDKAVLIYCILENKRIDIGRLINDRLWSIAQHPGEWSLGFPCLITQLCKAKDVATRANDDKKTVPKMHNITKTTITRAVKVDDEEEVQFARHRADMGEGPQYEHQEFPPEDRYKERFDRIDQQLERLGEHARRRQAFQQDIYSARVENDRYLWNSLDLDTSNYREVRNRYFNEHGYMLNAQGNPDVYPPPREQWAAPGDDWRFPGRRGAGQSRGRGASSSGAGGADDEDADMED